jgi:hypothetical protein
VNGGFIDGSFVMVIGGRIVRGGEGLLDPDGSLTRSRGGCYRATGVPMKDEMGVMV